VLLIALMLELGFISRAFYVVNRKISYMEAFSKWGTVHTMIVQRYSAQPNFANYIAHFNKVNHRNVTFPMIIKEIIAVDSLCVGIMKAPPDTQK
jgi:hypothetical protein